MFEDRSFDNLSGPLYEPGGGRLFERVIGKQLPNRVSDWAEHRPEDGIVSYGVAAKMNWPSPASGEELPYVNAQLFGILDEENRFKLWAEKSFKERRDGQPPTMDGFLPGLARPLRHQLPPLGSFPRTNDLETLLDRLDAAGLTWKV